MKSTDIPNGFVVMGPKGLPLLIDFDDKGIAVDGATELSSDGWLTMSKMGPDTLAMVHTVKGEEKMLVRALLVMRLHDEDQKSVTSNYLARKGLLFKMAEKIRSGFIADIEERERNPELKIKHEYSL